MSNPPLASVNVGSGCVLSNNAGCVKLCIVWVTVEVAALLMISPSRSAYEENKRGQSMDPCGTP